MKSRESCAGSGAGVTEVGLGERVFATMVGGFARWWR